MPNFCPDCGNKLKIPNPNYCPNCRKALAQQEIHKKAQPKMRTKTKTSIHDLGTKFEECVEVILKGMGFETVSQEDERKKRRFT